MEMQTITQELRQECCSCDDFSPIDACSKSSFQNSDATSDNKDNGFKEKVCISCKGIDVEIDFRTCENIYVNEIKTLQLNYSFRIIGQKDYEFRIQNLKTDEENSYKQIIGEGSILLEFPGVTSNWKNHHGQRNSEDGSVPNVQEYSEVFSINNHDHDVNDQRNEEEVPSSSSSTDKLTVECSETRSNKEDSCETIELILESDTTISVNSAEGTNSEIVDITETAAKDWTEIFDPSTLLRQCSNCSQVMEDGTMYLCLFGHDSCKDCKGKPCMLCQTMMGNAEAYCKYHHKGCTVFETPELLAKHEIDCEFNNYRCPIPRCVFLNTLSDLKLHFLNSHAKSLIQNNSILEVLYGRKDRKWYLYCYGSLFVCSYYYYVTHIEFILQYIGANDNAQAYMFEVEIKTIKDKKLAKQVRCAGWNDFSLCKGISYDYEDLKDLGNSRFQFTANLKIVNIGS